MITSSLQWKLRTSLLCCGFFVLAACGSGGSGPAETANETPPSAPSAVNASAGDGVVDISWNSVTGATGYNLYWGTSSGVTKQNGTRIAGVSSPHSLAGLTNGSPYYFIVSAENTMGEGAASAETSATPQISPPEQVTGLNASPLVQGVQLSWSTVSGADSYNVYWSTSTGVTPQTGTLVAAVSSPYTLLSLTAGTGYYFVVTAVNAGGEGQASAEVSSTPSAPVTGWSSQELINTPFDFFDTDHFVGDIDINDDGEAAAVWVEEGSDRDTARVMVNRFSGGLWGVPEILAGPSAFSPRTVIAPNGDVTVSYLLRGLNPDDSWLNATVRVRRYSNGSWSAPEQIDGIDLASFTFMHGMDIAVDAAGNVVASWIQDNAVIWANRYDVASDSWATATAQSNSIRLVQ
ncbi:MAG: fibronectin type III domain-containing protein, partial [Gammaproteobacteria bacterium]|nr:fibronectin type III domain-containing protein [Gammaproteobacteria bacterium]